MKMCPTDRLFVSRERACFVRGAVAGVFALLLVLFDCGECRAQAQKYHDAAIFDLVGPVKSCTETSSYNDSKSVYTFDVEGALKSESSDGEPCTDEFIRNEKGYPVMRVKGKSSSPFAILFGSMHNQDTIRYAYDSNDRIIIEEGSCKYERNSKGDVAGILFAYGFLFSSDADVRFFKDIQKDDHGNWLKRRVIVYVKEDEEKELGYEHRKITYWPEKSETSVEKFVEPDGCLTVEDMMYRPLGVLPINPDRNLWLTKVPELLKEAAKRSNWRTIATPNLCIYGNCNYGKRTPEGYNRTYSGEPVFAFDAHYWPNGDINWYSYSFLRDIAGKAPNEQRPCWTNDNAVAFAMQLVLDLEVHGLRFQPAKNGKGDIFTRVAEDEHTFYKVRVFKKIDRYSAFLSVDLELFPVESSFNTLRKKK